ncbi:MFS transporter [Paenibacillus sp. SI8]|uniref:MFS transporter n=1 Tax=unclassified Paenibacillus TaxID=185978 RepID=UPI0034672A4F
MKQYAYQPRISPRNNSSRWIALIALMAAQFMIVIDIAGLNVALPSIKQALHFSETNLQWVVSAYQIMFGGCLLLGGRIADLWGRKRMFLISTALFSVTSLLCGLAWSDTSLIVFRAIQGISAALLAPTSLSTVTRMFSEGRERNIALGIWGAVFGAGGALGSVLSGIITTTFGWTWFFFFNVPLGVFALIVGPLLLPKDNTERKSQKLDVAGALTVSSGMMAFLYALTQAPQVGWTAPSTILYLLTALFLFFGFTLIQRKAKSPLLPLFLVGQPTMKAGIIIGVLAGSYHFSLFFLLTLYMQNVLHFSALQTAFGYLAAAVFTILCANLISRLIPRFGVKRLLITGQLLVTAMFIYLTRIPAEGNYFIDLLPALIIGGIGWGLIFPSINILSFSGLEKIYSGTAAGIINMSEQLGGAVGITMAAIVASVWTGKYMQANPDQGIYAPEAMTAGFHAVFWVLAGLAALSVICTAVFNPTYEKTNRS